VDDAHRKRAPTGPHRPARRWIPAALGLVLVLVLAVVALAAGGGEGGGRTLAAKGPSLLAVLGDRSPSVPRFGTTPWSLERCCGLATGDGGHDWRIHVDERELEAMTTLGLPYARGFVYPCVTGADTEALRWLDHYGEVIARAATNGVQVLPVLEQGMDCTGAAGDPPDEPAERDAMREAAEHAARRFGPIRRAAGGQVTSGELWVAAGCRDDGSGCRWRGRPMDYLPVRAWQVWNEQNSAGHWEGGPDPEAYLRMLVETRAGLRAADPEARVVAGGLAFVPDSTARSMTPSEFLERVLDLPGGSCAFDSAAVHFYDRNGTPAELERHLADVRDVLDDGGAAEAGIWLTELGASTLGAEDGEAARGEASQAAWLEEALGRLAARAADLDLGAVLHFGWKDVTARGLSGNDVYYEYTGLYESLPYEGAPLDPKPAAEIAGTAARAATALPLAPPRHC